MGLITQIRDLIMTPIFKSEMIEITVIEIGLIIAFTLLFLGVFDRK